MRFPASFPETSITVGRIFRTMVICRKVIDLVGSKVADELFNFSLATQVDSEAAARSWHTAIWPDNPNNVVPAILKLLPENPSVLAASSDNEDAHP
jgi:hypothetical protein